MQCGTILPLATRDILIAESDNPHAIGPSFLHEYERAGMVWNLKRLKHGTTKRRLLVIPALGNRAREIIPLHRGRRFEIDMIAARCWNHIRANLQPNPRLLVERKRTALNMPIKRAFPDQRVCCKCPRHALDLLDLGWENYIN